MALTEKENYTSQYQQEEENSLFTVSNILDILFLHWKWFVLSSVVCLAGAGLYLKMVTPKYMASAKILIKEEDSGSRTRSKFAAVMNAENLGTISNSTGIDNEIEIIASRSVIEDAVKAKKLYVDYLFKGRLRNQPIYRYQPLNVDLDSASLADLVLPITMKIVPMKNGGYKVAAKYSVIYKDERPNEDITFTKKIKELPAVINTKVGKITITKNPECGFRFDESREMLVRITSPEQAAVRFHNALNVEQTGKQTSILQVTLVDVHPERARDFLEQLSVSYNNEANYDKNVVAHRTEEFINQRLEKLNAELGVTEGRLEDFKQQNNVIRLDVNASTALTQSTAYEQKITDNLTQIALLQSITDFMNQSHNEYKPLPTNVGIADPAASSLIQKYNELVIQRARLLRSASESSQIVTSINDDLDALSASIRQAMSQSIRNLEIERQSLRAQYAKYSSEVHQTPAQERMLTQIGREQEVRSGLYLMLLQKREENSISLSATADKGKLIDKPAFNGQVSPKKTMILLIGLLIGLALPLAIFLLLQLLRYKIEGREDVQKLTKIPIIADVAVANDKAKSKADIVVHENSNTQMEEIFRSLRTNLQFTMDEGENVVMFTSSMSGEGKTFIAANLAVSFALLGKKVILIGLDIRKPRLAELFHINDHKHGITPLLAMANPTKEDIHSQILPSGVNDRLDLLMAGPIPPNPAELMSRKSLDIVIGELRQSYDYVIIDTAPVGLVTDTLQIGRVSNATIFVCRADYTPKSCFGYLNELRNENKLPNLSVVLNGIDMSKKKFSYYYGYGKYGNYGRYGHYGRGTYGHYGVYGNSTYGSAEDDSIKK